MKTENRVWTAQHFSQGNPAGPRQGDVPSLLRRVARTLEKLGPLEVRDLVLHTEVTAEGPWHSLTIYYDRLDATSGKKRTSRGRRTPR